jgi:hypothetical protein
MVSWMNPMHRMQTTDEVCNHYDGKPKIRLEIRPFPPVDGVDNAPAVFVETDPMGFEFLGHLFLAFARSDEGCGRHLGPDVAGCAYFAPECRLGLLLHRLPCEHSKTPL